MQTGSFCELTSSPTPGQSGERGLGLGLFIVESFARLLNHPISVRSAPASGSCFEILVPIVPAVSGALSAAAGRQLISREVGNAAHCSKG